MNSKLIKILGFAATVVTMLASLASDYVNEKKMEEKIEEKVNEALDNRNNKEESC